MSQRIAALFLCFAQYWSYLHLHSTDTPEGFKINAQYCTLHTKKAEELKSNCMQQLAWLAEKEICRVSFQVNPCFYKNHHTLHASATSA